MKNIQSRRFLLTINNPKPDYTHERIKEIAVTKFKTFEFLAISDEIGKEGTYHSHLLLCFRSAVRFSTVKKQFSTAHIDICRGTIQQNLDYIKKKGKHEGSEKAETTVANTFETLGDRPPESRGKRHDMEELYRLVVEEELSNSEIIAINQDYIPMIDKIDRLRTMYLTEKFRGQRRTEIEVTYICGKTGAGKSRYVLDTFGDANVYRVTDYEHPFDGYEMQNVIVFEEFRSSLPIGEMLNYIDIYPVQLRARYNNKYACYLHVFIISNYSLEEQYTDMQRLKNDTWNAFIRRIKTVREYTDVGVFKEYDGAEAYLNRKNERFIDIKSLPIEEQLQIPFDEDNSNE